LTHDEHPSRSNSNDGDMSVNGDISNQNNNKMEGEKRKEPPEGDESVDPHDIDPKRRDDKENKIAKKPGRKPLTSEPTSKRKAQNRAAQRAFRERKEKHLKDLEQKVDDLEKASESANHENSMLRAQVDRLQTELREYKRRLHTTEINRSTASLASLGNFHFDFPLFGGDGVFGNKDKKNYKLSLSSGRIDKQQTLPSPNNGDVTSGSSKSLQSPLGLASSNLADLFSPSILDTVNKSAGQDYMDSLDTSSIQSTPKLNGGYDVNSSPSASSVSQHGPGSSRGTTPKNVGPSPRPNDMMMPICEENLGVSVIDKDYVCKSGGLDGETETTFCEKLGMACGNPNNPIPKVPQFSTASETTTNSLDWLAQQSSNNTFDPVIFNDYRDPINDINSSINMSFFDDAFPITNFDLLGAPITTEGNQQPQSQPQSIHQQQRLPQPLPRKDLLAEIDAINNSDDEFVPGDDPKKMLSCNKIWDRISSHPRFVSGELDMDGLCSELRSKAKCSESGVVVSENDVQEVLGKVAPSDDLFSTVCPKSRGLV
jgi:AP-1-like factor